MKFTKLADRVGGPGADAWDIHFAAIERQRNGDNIIVLSIGQEMLEATPSVIIEAANNSLQRARHHYSEIGGEEDLRAAIAKRYSAQLGRAIEPDNVAVMSGAQNALFAASLCVLEAGDEAIVLEPYYATYPATFTVGGARLVPITTKPENDFIPSADDIMQKINERTRAIIVNSPHNPSGMVYPRELINQIVQICRSNNIWLISDEVYAFLAEPGTFCSPASLPDAFDHCITVSSVSKSHRMTGWRVGWAIASKPLIDQMFNLSVCMSYGLPMFTQDAALVALEHSAVIEAEVRREINRKRQMVISLLNQIDGIVVRGSKVGMFVVFDVRAVPVSANTFAWQLLEHYDVAVLPCTAFGPSGTGILRMNIGESDENLQHACDRIGKLIRSL